MAKITDPDDLVRTEHVAYNTGTKRITVTIGQVLSGALTISVDAGAKTYIRSTGNFLTDGFLAGVQVTMAGHTASGGANNGLRHIVSITQTTNPGDTITVSETCTTETGSGDETVASAELTAKDGVALKCLYSYTKEEWKSDAALIPYDFPFTPITDEQFELIEGWDFADDSSRYLIRDGGWSVVDPTTGLPNAKWTGIVSLGSIETDDQPYFQQVALAAAVDFQTTGVVNQPVQVFKDADADGVQEGGDFDYTAFLSVFVREQAQVYGKSKLSDIGVSALAYQAYRFPLATSADLNVAASDATIAADLPYTKIVARYFSAAYARPVDSAALRSFGIVVDVGTHSGIDGSAPGGNKVLTTAEGDIDVSGNPFAGGTLTVHNGANAGTYLISASTPPTATTVTLDATEANLAAQSDMDFTLQRAAPVVASKQEIYEKVQYLLRQTGDIDVTGGASVIGNVADELAVFVGPTLSMGSKAPENPNAGGTGVIIEGFDANDTNDLVFYDNGGVARTYPFVAAGTIAFNPNLDDDADAAYWMFFDYTERFTNAGFGISGVSGQAAVLDSSITDLTAELASGDYVRLSGFAAPGDNGIWQLTGAPAGVGPWTAAVTKVDSIAPSNEAAGATVSLDKNPIDSPDAIVVNDNAGDPISGVVPGASVGFDFDYDNNAQGGRTAATNAAVVIRALGLNTAQFVETSGTIIRATGQSFSLVAPLERNYANV